MQTNNDINYKYPIIKQDIVVPINENIKIAPKFLKKFLPS